MNVDHPCAAASGPTLERSAAWRRLPPLVLAVLVLQACGGGGGDESASGSSTATAAPAPATVTSGSGTSSASSTSTPSAPAPAVHTCGLADFEAEALRLINQHRAAGASCGSRGSFAPTNPLAHASRLLESAYGHSLDMATQNYFSHTSLDGRTISDRISATGYGWSTIGENIAAGQSSVSGVMAGWMASDGHCANIMNPNFTEFALACARNDASQYRIYWTMNLARPR